MTMTFVVPTMPVTSTTATAWWGHCPRCGAWFDQHSIYCPEFASGNMSVHRSDCRCTTCRPDLHLTHPDTLACERDGCQPNKPPAQQ